MTTERYPGEKLEYDRMDQSLAKLAAMDWRLARLAAARVVGDCLEGCADWLRDHSPLDPADLDLRLTKYQAAVFAAEPDNTCPEFAPAAQAAWGQAQAARLLDWLPALRPAPTRLNPKRGELTRYNTASIPVRMLSALATGTLVCCKFEHVPQEAFREVLHAAALVPAHQKWLTCGDRTLRRDAFRNELSAAIDRRINVLEMYADQVPATHPAGGHA